MKILYAITLDLPYKTADSESVELMNWLSHILDVKINYTIERKKANNKPHIHAYCTVHPIKLENALKLYFGGLSFKIQPCYDLTGWRKYITKEDELKIAQPIKPIKPIEPIEPIKPIKKGTKPTMSEYGKLLNAYPRTAETKEKMSKMLQAIKEEQKLKQPFYDEVIKQNKIFAKKLNEENRSNKNLKRIIYYGVNYKEL